MEIAAGWAGIMSTLHDHDGGDDDYDDDSDDDDDDVEDDDNHWQGVLQPSSNLFDWKLLAEVFLLPNINSKTFTFITFTFTFSSKHKLKDFPVCIIHFHFPSTPQLQDVPFSSKINLSSKNKLKDLPFDNLHTLTYTH